MLMSAKSFSLVYDGYWREANVSYIPLKSGVYSVYAGTHNRTENTVHLRKLIYIGESENVRKRVSDHEKLRAWRQYLNSGEELCFNFAPITTERLRVEAALINYHKPPENTEYVNSFPFNQATVLTSGRDALLSSRFTVRRTAVYQY